MKSAMDRLLSIAVMVTAVVACEAIRAVDADSPSVTELTIKQATELAGRHGDLELDHLRVLSPQVADLLARSNGSIMLNGLTSLLPESAAALSQPDVFLELDGLTELPLDTALALVTPTSPRALSLRGLKAVNDELAELMGQNSSHLRL
jgi:hypothetical protein